MFGDLRLAVRRFVRQPRFTVLSVVILSLGSGLSGAPPPTLARPATPPRPFLRPTILAADRKSGHLYLAKADISTWP
jgi:hypothetical protein